MDRFRTERGGWCSRCCVALAAVAACLSPLRLSATSYRPMSDQDLARQAAVIVRARVTGRRVKIEEASGRPVPVTIVTLETLEAFKGSPGETIELRLPGGEAGDLGLFVDGTPTFSKGEETVLFLDPLAWKTGAYRLSEFGLSKFDLVSDERGRRFAVRRVFSPESDLVLSGVEASRGSGAVRDKESVPQRDAASFLDGLRAVKVLDACATPSHSYWVFAAGLTNLGSNLVVTDTVTGQFRIYANPVGTRYQPIQDTTTFAACP
jgi:hypothetical protein